MGETGSDSLNLKQNLTSHEYQCFELRSTLNISTVSQSECTTHTHAEEQEQAPNFQNKSLSVRIKWLLFDFSRINTTEDLQQKR